MELLALNPDHVRELHRLFAEGAGIDVEIHQAGQRIETLLFEDLVARSSNLREQVLVPVAVPAEVRGPGVRRQPARITTNDYLPDCGDCTDTTPCETECGYDPGKGGPVTCGEYGMGCQADCPPQQNWGEYYTDWYFYGSGPSGWGECYVTEYYNRWHDEYVYVWRRDRIRQTNNCPNSPSCDGCYITEQVVGYQLTYDSCYARTAYTCSPAYMPCCGALCTWFPGIPCSDDWPC